MFELLKNLAVQKLQEKMAPNSLGTEATSAAAEEGSSELLSSLMEQVKSGDLSAITSLFSNDGNATADNGIVQGLVGTLSGIFQNKGMAAEEAQTEASNVAPELLDDIKEKFLSSDAADNGFDVSQLSNLVGGDLAGNLLNTAKGMF